MSEIEQDVKKSQDKLDIQEEEKQKQQEPDEPPAEKPDAPPEEEAKADGDQKEAPEEEAATVEEATKSKGSLKKGLSNIKSKIPPIFSRSKSKERKEKKTEGGENEEDKQLLQGEEAPLSPTKTDEAAGAEEEEKVPAKSWSKEVLAKIPKVKMPSNPFKKSATKGCEPVELEEKGEKAEDAENKDQEEEEEKKEEEEKTEQPKPVSRTTQLLKAIRAPLEAVWPRRNKEKDAEAGETDPEKQKLDSEDVEDGLEKVELNDVELGTEKNEKVEEKDATATDEESLVGNLKSTFQQHRFLIIGLIVFLSLLLLLIILAVTGPRRPRYNEILINGTYVTTVTSCGPVEGKLDEGEFTFKGIPYAVPPVDNLRFAPAKPLRSLEQCWNGTFRAWTHNSSESGPNQCWQLYRNGSHDGDEDCLTLDVYTRRVRHDAPLPVVVIISSETMVGGHSFRPARGMARQRDVVYVQPRFRLGAFGFLASSIISSTTYPPHSGNYALTDVIAALEWVQINIEHFGGDPDAVTVVGHRAGASLVTALTALGKRREAPIQRLFNQVWLSSGSGVLANQTLKDAESAGREFFNAVGCPTAECVRRLDPEDILDRVPEDWKKNIWKSELPIGPPPIDQHHWIIQDGVVVRQNLMNAWRENGLPYKVVFGTTAHVEATKELQSKKDWTQRVNFENYVRGSVLGSSNVPNGIFGEVLKRYEPPSWPQLASMISDLRTICPLYQTAKELASVKSTTMKTGNRHASSVHFYVVTQTRNSNYYGNVADMGADIEAILGLYEAHSPEEKRYLSAMQNFFYRFVWHQELPPGASGSERSSALPQNIIMVGQDVSIKSSYNNCDFWIQRGLTSNYARVE
ncbi:neurotactin isoform X2 [Neocloeon triangulifer]|nr:neurotactin isoform X2 [Neocloeon triangulifer]XP_059478727.1 neurotactin isoform X2 [Neocloeon triangulifer]